MKSGRKFRGRKPAGTLPEDSSNTRFDYNSWLVSSLLTAGLHLHPDAAKLDGSSFTYAEIEAADNFDQLVFAKIDAKVEDIMHGSFEKNWQEALQEYAKLNLEKKETEPIVEVFRRRNILIHNEGIANNSYFKNLPSQLTQDAKNGKEILLTDDYVRSAILIFEKFFLKVAFCCWENSTIPCDERDDCLLEVTERLMSEERWDSALVIAELSVKNTKPATCLSSRARSLQQVNVWHCQKKKGTLDRKAVEQFDLSDKHEYFNFCRTFLLEERPENLEGLLERVVKSKVLPLHIVESSPVFEDFRRSTGFLAWREKCQPKSTGQTLKALPENLTTEVPSPMAVTPENDLGIDDDNLVSGEEDCETST